MINNKIPKNNNNNAILNTPENFWNSSGFNNNMLDEEKNSGHEKIQNNGCEQNENQISSYLNSVHLDDNYKTTNSDNNILPDCYQMNTSGQDQKNSSDNGQMVTPSTKVSTADLSSALKKFSVSTAQSRENLRQRIKYLIFLREIVI